MAWMGWRAAKVAMAVAPGASRYGNETMQRAFAGYDSQSGHVSRQCRAMPARRPYGHRPGGPSRMARPRRFLVNASQGRGALGCDTAAAGVGPANAKRQRSPMAALRLPTAGRPEYPLGRPIGEIVLFARMISPRSLPRGRSPAGKRKLRLASRVESQSGNVPSRIHPAESINQFS
jgi:hypothetical protein